MGLAARDVLKICWRVLLRRDPEYSYVIYNSPIFWERTRRFLFNSASRNRSIAKAGASCFHYVGSNHIDLSCGAEDMGRLREHVRDVWTKYGDDDPHWSVLTSPRYRKGELTPSAERSFYETGKSDVDAFVAACRRSGLSPRLGGSVLDFGCGVGRMGEHLSAMFQRYIGVDVSAPHLNFARKRLQYLGRRNFDFFLLDEFLAGTADVDVAISLIVLQHNPPPMMVMLIDAILSRLKPGGIAFFQIPCVIFGYNFILPEYLVFIEHGGIMEMHALPQSEVFNILSRNNCRPIEVILDGKIGDKGFSYTFLARKDL